MRIKAHATPGQEKSDSLRTQPLFKVETLGGCRQGSCQLKHPNGVQNRSRYRSEINGVDSMKNLQALSII